MDFVYLQKEIIINKSKTVSKYYIGRNSDCRLFALHFILLLLFIYSRGRNSDYKYSGYDRGHLAAAGNHKANQKHLDQTFVLSNISPQVGAGFNRDKWAELEKHSRKLLKQYPNVYVCTGPLYLPM